MSQTDDMEVDDPPLSNIVEREARMDVDPLPPLPKGIPKVREGPPPQRSHTQQRHPPPAPEPSGAQRAHTHKQPSGALLGSDVPKIQFHLATYSMNLHVGSFACDEGEEHDTGPPPYVDGQGSTMSSRRGSLIALLKKLRIQANPASASSPAELPDGWATNWRDSQECVSFRHALIRSIKLRLVETDLQGWPDFDKRWLRGAVHDCAQKHGIAAYESEWAELSEGDRGALREDSKTARGANKDRDIRGSR